MPPNELKLQDAIISFGTQYINDDTSKALYDASFSVRNIGSCGLDSVRVIKGQFCTYKYKPKAMGHRSAIFICERIKFENDSIKWRTVRLLRVAHSLLVITDVTKIY